jgi:hypothetical protein
MKTPFKIASIALTFLFSSALLSAQNYSIPEKNKPEVSIELDPATFVFGGYSAHLRLKPANSKHMLYGVGIYAMNMPSVFVDLNEKNADMGWDVRINNAVGLFGEYHFSEVNRKFFVGTQVGVQEFRIENEGTPGKETFTNALLMGYGGYTLQPFDQPIYFKFWGGAGYTTKLSGENNLQNEEYDIAPVSIFATLHVGYTF